MFKTRLTIMGLHFSRVSRMGPHIFGISGVRKFWYSATTNLGQLLLDICAAGLCANFQYNFSSAECTRGRQGVKQFCTASN